MRSKDYSNQAASFTPLQPVQMARVALVEGLKPKYAEGERRRYRRLLESYSGVDKDRIEALFRILKTGSRSQKEQRFLNALVNDVAYDSGAWNPFDYDSF